MKTMVNSTLIKSLNRNGKKKLKGLGVFAREKKVFLFYRLTEPQKNPFLLATSDSAGLDFHTHPENPTLTDQKGKETGTKKCQDFRISKLKNQYFLAYQAGTGKQTSLHGAVSKNLISWQTIGKIPRVKQTGMLVPGYQYQGQYVLYFGKDAIKIAFSKDFKKWQISPKPVLTLPKEQKNDFNIKIGTILVTDGKILVLYYLLPKNNHSHNYSIQAVFFDQNNPKEVLKKPDQAVWQEEVEWHHQPAKPIGLVVLGGKLISYWQTEDEEIFALSHPYFQTILSGDKPRFPLILLKKLYHNPLLRPILKHLWESQLVFNPAAVYLAGKVHLVYRAVGETGISVLGYASSKDGLYIDKRLDKPIYIPKEHFESTHPAPQVCFVPYMSGGGCGGCEDPKITQIDDRIYMTYVAWDGWQPPRVALTSIAVDDFINHRWHWSKSVLISPPDIIDKSAVIFPEKVNGQYLILHRIFPNILFDFVDNLDFDGQTKWLGAKAAIKPRKNMWDSRKISAGPPPIKTDDGWLLIYHAADEHDHLKYKIGAMLLDKNDPTRVLARTNQPILEPTEQYENEGHKFGIVYPSGAVTLQDQLIVYYGGADTVCCAATANLPKFLNQLKQHQAPVLKPTAVN